MPGTAPTSAAQRQRRCRARLKASLCQAWGDLPPGVVHALIDAGWIGQGLTDDRWILGGAVVDLLKQVLRECGTFPSRCDPQGGPERLESRHGNFNRQDRRASP